MNTNRTNQALTREMLEELRLSRNLTQQQMADFMGVTRSYYAQVACGAVSISKKFARKAFEAYPELAKLNNNEQVLNIVDNPANNTPSQDGPELAVVPAEHLEVVVENNDLLQAQSEKIDAQTEQIEAQGRQLEAIVRFTESFGNIVRRNVHREVHASHQFFADKIFLQINHVVDGIEEVIDMIECEPNNRELFVRKLNRIRNNLIKINETKFTFDE